VEALRELEELAKGRAIDLLYGDECQVSLLPCIPYGWQFADEEVAMPTARGAAVNCFALLTRANACCFATTTGKITAAFVFEQLESLSMGLRKLTVVVLDNARVHRAKLIRERIRAWQARGLFVFYLPAYSPHLNIVETLWRKLKYEWLMPEHYETTQSLFYAVRQALAAVGTGLKIRFSAFRNTAT
jgi:transposase